MSLSTSLLGTMLAAAAAHDANGTSAPDSMGPAEAYAPNGQTATETSFGPFVNGDTSNPTPASTALPATSLGRVRSLLNIALGLQGIPIPQSSDPGDMASHLFAGREPILGSGQFAHTPSQLGFSAFRPGGNPALANVNGPASGANAPNGAGASQPTGIWGDLTSLRYQRPPLGSLPTLPIPTISNPPLTVDKPALPYVPTGTSTSIDDSAAQDLFATARRLQQQAAALQFPRNPGMSLAQALVGIGGAIATQGNPHAQFVAGFLPALGQAIQQQYGNTQQAWDMARQGLLQQADAYQRQAEAMLEAGLKRHGIDVGYAGKLGSAQVGAQGKEDVAAIQQNGLSVRAALQRAGRDGATAAQLILSEDPSARIQGYDILRQNGLSNWTDEAIAEAAQTTTAKQAMEAAGANFKNVTAQPAANRMTNQSNLDRSKAQQIDALLPARIAALQQVASLSKARQAEIAQKTAFMGAGPAAVVGTAAGYADLMRGLDRLHSNRIGLGYGGLTQEGNSAAQAQIRAGIGALEAQGVPVRNRIDQRTRELSLQNAQDPRAAQQAIANDPELNALNAALHGYHDQLWELQNTIQGLAQSSANSSKIQNSQGTPPAKTSGSKLFSPVPPFGGSAGPGPTQIGVIPQGNQPDPSPVNANGVGASNAVASANQRKASPSAVAGSNGSFTFAGPNPNAPVPGMTGMTQQRMVDLANAMIAAGPGRPAVLNGKPIFGPNGKPAMGVDREKALAGLRRAGIQVR